MGSELYKSANNLQRTFAKLQADENVGVEDKRLILSFAETRLAKGHSKIRINKVVYCLRRLSQWLKKGFRHATKDDLVALVGLIEGMSYADYSKHDFKVVLKMFYRWLKGNDEQNPPETAWLKPRVKNRGSKLPEDLLTEEEVLRMSQAATNARDKALVLVLYESGCRIGELLSLRLKNVAFDQYGAVLRVSGKTGDRRVRIISSAPVLTSWLEQYAETSPDASLWPPIATNHRKPTHCLEHRSVYVVLQKLAASAGVNKTVYPHLFRHSRATALANKLTEAQMKEFFGWTQSSEMASVYVHLSGRDVDNALLALQGFAKPVEAQQDSLKLAFCQRCREKNSPSNKFCCRCGTPFNPDLLAKSDDLTGEEDILLKRLLQNKEFKDYLAEKVVSLGLHKPKEGIG